MLAHRHRRLRRLCTTEPRYATLFTLTPDSVAPSRLPTVVGYYAHVSVQGTRYFRTCPIKHTWTRAAHRCVSLERAVNL
eukprot:1352681-Amphidinium_carterae.2